MNEHQQHQHGAQGEALGHGHHEHHHGHDHKHLVHVTVDNRQVELPPGNYIVSTFKVLVGVSADRLLDKVIGPGKFVHLPDTETIHIVGGECFVSYVKQGSSS